MHSSGRQRGNRLVVGLWVPPVALCAPSTLPFTSSFPRFSSAGFRASLGISAVLLRDGDVAGGLGKKSPAHFFRHRRSSCARKPRELYWSETGPTGLLTSVALILLTPDGRIFLAQLEPGNGKTPERTTRRPGVSGRGSEAGGSVGNHLGAARGADESFVLQDGIGVVADVGAFPVAPFSRAIGHVVFFVLRAVQFVVVVVVGERFGHVHGGNERLGGGVSTAHVGASVNLEQHIDRSVHLEGHSLQRLAEGVFIVVGIPRGVGRTHLLREFLHDGQPRFVLHRLREEVKRTLHFRRVLHPLPQIVKHADGDSPAVVADLRSGKPILEGHSSIPLPVAPVVAPTVEHMSARGFGEHFSEDRFRAPGQSGHVVPPSRRAPHPALAIYRNSRKLSSNCIFKKDPVQCPPMTGIIILFVLFFLVS